MFFLVPIAAVATKVVATTTVTELFVAGATAACTVKVATNKKAKKEEE